MPVCPACHQQIRALSAEDRKAICGKSTEREAQNRKLIAFLRIGPHHTYELRRQGISHPAGRIQDLEEAGYVIQSDRILVVDENGFSHPNVAVYTLMSEPLAEAQETTKTGSGAPKAREVACE